MLAGQGDNYSYSSDDYANHNLQRVHSDSTSNNHSSKFFDRVLQLSSESERQGKSARGPPSKQKRPKFKYQDADPTNPHPRPSLSYNELILEAIHENPAGMASLQEIYDHIKGRYPFFRDSKIAWQNSVRHNLSVQKMFMRVKRPAESPGKGGLWRILPWAIMNLKNQSIEENDGEDEGVSAAPLPVATPRTAPVQYSHMNGPPPSLPTFAASNPTNSYGSSSNVAPSFAASSQAPNAYGGIANTVSSFAGAAQTVAPYIVPRPRLAQPYSPLPDMTASPSKAPQIKRNHLMDTLATLALSSEGRESQWPYQPLNQSQNFQLPTPFSVFNERVEQPEPQIPQITLQQQRYGLMLDPNVGDKTLLQATNFSDLGYSATF